MIMVNNEKNVERMKFDKIMNEIEFLLDSGFRVPPFGAVVSAKNVMSQLKNLKKAVYDATDEAEHIVSVKEKIIAEARQEADDIVRRRHLELSKQPVLKEAEMIAKKMLLQAKEESDRLRREAEEFQRQVKERTYEYADMIFEELEKGMNESRKRITRDRQGLKSILENKDTADANIQDEQELLEIEPTRQFS